jgi:hypothetical protein
MPNALDAKLVSTLAQSAFTKSKTASQFQPRKANAWFAELARHNVLKVQFR